MRKNNGDNERYIKRQREKEKSLSREKDRQDKLDRRAYEALAYEREDEKEKTQQIILRLEQS